MAQATFQISRRLNVYVQRLSDKQGFGMAPAVAQLVESLIKKGIVRLQNEQLLEREDKIRLAEDNLRRLVNTMGMYSVEKRKFPVIDDECYQYAFKKLNPIWPFN